MVTTDLSSEVVEQMKCRCSLSRMHSIPIYALRPRDYKGVRIWPYTTDAVVQAECSEVCRGTSRQKYGFTNPVGTFAGVQISLVQSRFIWCSRNLHRFQYIVDIRARATEFIWLVL